MKSIATLVACLVCSLSVSAGAAVDAGPVPPPVPDAGPAPCRTTDDCAPPTPYCHPTLHACVQCLGDLNCYGVAYVCNQEKGVCTNCRTNADCYAGTPYCSTSLGACVACLTDANCGNQGVHCATGVCGSCGDGICSDIERSQSFLAPCKDCYIGCAKTDLRSKVGDKVASGALTESEAYTTACGPPGNSGASFTWTAPADGTYSFDGGPNSFVSLMLDDCGGQALGCSSMPASAYLTKGQKLAVVLTGASASASDYTLAINPVNNTNCDPVFCPSGPNGELSCCQANDTCGITTKAGCIPASAPPQDPGATMACVGAASMAGEGTCMEATYCGCNACPKDHYVCSTIGGCDAIVTCMARYACSGPDCYTPDRCMSVIDANGGPAGAVFTDAQNRAVCERAAGCLLACPGTSGPDASVGGETGGTFNGTAGNPGVGNGSGTGGARRSPGAGQDAGADTHGKAASTTGGCGCTVPAQKRTPWSAFGTIVGLGLAMARRRGHKRKNGGSASRQKPPSLRCY